MLYQEKTLYAFETDAFEEVRDLSLCLEEPTLDEGNPVVRVGGPDEPDAGKICYTASVERWRDGYGMWYQAEDQEGRSTRCFASSADGFDWQKRGVVGEGRFNTLGETFNVFNDGERFLAPMLTKGTEAGVEPAFAALRPDDIPDARRRALAEKHMARTGRCGVKTFVGVATSDDGLRWQMPEPTPRLPMFLEPCWLYRFQERYIMNSQTHGNWLEPPVPGHRLVAFFTSRDLRNWDPQPGYMKNIAHETTGGMTHVGIVPIKCIDDRLLVGLGGRFDEGRELPDQHFEVTLLYSTDGLEWKPVAPEHERRSWIRRGRGGEWDFGGVTGMGLVERGDEAAVYYSGTTIGNGCHSCPSYDCGPCQVGRVRFGRDRFTALQPTVGWNAIFAAAQAAGARGELTTRPLQLSTARALSLNVDIPPDATVQVELLADDGGVHETVTVVDSGTAVRVPLQQPVPAAPVRLRLTLTGGAAPDRVPRLFALEY